MFDWFKKDDKKDEKHDEHIKVGGEIEVGGEVEVSGDIYVDGHVTKKKVDEDIDKHEEIYKNEESYKHEEAYKHEEIYKHEDLYKNEEIYKHEDIYSYKEDVNIYEDIKYEEDIKIDINFEGDFTAGTLIQDSYITEYINTDVNDIESYDLFNFDGATVTMDDITVDQLAIGNSFNGQGNDSQIDIDQSNDLDDADQTHGTGAHYNNNQNPDADGVYVDAKLLAGAEEKAGLAVGGYVDAAAGGFIGNSTTASTTTEGTIDIPSLLEVIFKGEEGEVSGSTTSTIDSTTLAAAGARYNEGFFGVGGYMGSAFLGAALTGSVDEFGAPDTAFQTVTAEGGSSSSDDGIEAAYLNDAGLDAEGNATIEGSSVATADASATASAFDVLVNAGSNQLANVASVDYVGGNLVDGGDVEKVDLTKDSVEPAAPVAEAAEGKIVQYSDVYLDDTSEVNDIDLSDLIEFSSGMVELDDFDMNVVAIGDSFNGLGNDTQFDVDQTNDLVDGDLTTDTYSTYTGTGWNGPFQDVTATGGEMAAAEDGIDHITGHGATLDAGGNAAISGAALGSADAVADASAFTVDVVVGANFLINQYGLDMVAGDKAAFDDADDVLA